MKAKKGFINSRIQNEDGTFKGRLLKDAETKSFNRPEISNNFYSSNFSATQNPVDLSDMTDSVVGGFTEAGE